MLGRPTLKLGDRCIESLIKSIQLVEIGNKCYVTANIECQAVNNTGNIHYSESHFKENFGLSSSQSDLINMKPDTGTVSSYGGPYSDPITIAEMTNELEERNKRSKGLVIHNLPEGSDIEDEERVSKLLREVLESKTKVEVESDENTSMLRMYRLGRKQPNKTRSLKVHLKSAKTRDLILDNARRLSLSEDFNKIVIQKDMTPLERIHLKQLVHEKNRRNHLARMNHEEPNWTIRGRIICQRTRC